MAGVFNLDKQIEHLALGFIHLHGSSIGEEAVTPTEEEEEEVTATGEEEEVTATEEEEVTATGDVLSCELDPFPFLPCLSLPSFGEEVDLSSTGDPGLDDLGPVAMLREQ